MLRGPSNTRDSRDFSKNFTSQKAKAERRKPVTSVSTGFCGHYLVLPCKWRTPIRRTSFTTQGTGLLHCRHSSLHTVIGTSTRCNGSSAACRSSRWTSMSSPHRGNKSFYASLRPPTGRNCKPTFVHTRKMSPSGRRKSRSRTQQRACVVLNWEQGPALDAMYTGSQ